MEKLRFKLTYKELKVYPGLAYQALRIVLS